MALAATWAAAPSFARAELQLDWSAPAACPDEAAVRGAIERAQEPVDGPRAALSVAADVQAHGEAYALTLTVRSPSGTSRERLYAGDCALFVRLIALKVALLSTTEDAAVSGAARPSKTTDAVRSAWSIRAQALASTAPLPAAGLGAAVGVGYRFHWLQLEGIASYLFPREQFFAEQPAVGGSFQGWAVGARACGIAPWPASPALALAGCAGAEAGFVRGEGVSVSPANVTDQPVLTLTAGASATAALGRLLGLRLDVEALFGLVRPEFYVRNLGQLDRAPGVGARALLDLEVRLP